MCILFIALNQHPKYPLIITANRDEYFERPTQASHYWEYSPTLLAGRDLQAGGTWLGVNQQREFAALTNLRDMNLIKEHARSRGELVQTYLNHAHENFPQWLTAQVDHFNPFNLIWGNQEQLFVFNSVQKVAEPVSDGFHSISNGYLDDYWVKMSQGTQRLKQYVQHHDNLVADELVQMLHDTTPAADELLPNTGVDRSIEKTLSSIFIPATPFNSGLYGTRSSAVLLFSESQLSFTEYVYQVDGRVQSQQSFLIE